MSFGKMNTLIDIIRTVPVKDSAGFAVESDTVLATVRAYKEDRHGDERWANMAAFSTASALFRFRMIPGLDVSTSLFISCADGRYRILSAEDVRGRGMYVEVLTEKLEPSVR
ncbi:MAG TPA: head-tail adaptor protein [Caproicibacter sp.]|nr:head-tail adaptor protein [Caproicibacter sp.]